MKTLEPTAHRMKLTHHGSQDYQSLLMHQEAVRLILEDPSLAEKAQEILSRWDRHVGVRSKPLRDVWVQIISNGNWDLALEDSERGNQLRQASPLSVLLPNKRRVEIIRSVKKLRETGHA
jgi:hypothetical protein